MTQDGKCDVCRQRKIKCNEARPVCGPCRKSLRSCTYDFVKKQQFVTFVDNCPSQCKPQCGYAHSMDDTSSSDHATGVTATKLSVRRSTKSRLPVIMLPVRMNTNAAYGDGHFQKFKLSVSEDDKSTCVRVRKNELRSASPLINQPLSPETSLVLRWKAWGEMLCPNEPLPYIIGEYLEMIPQRIGNTKVFDVALECLIRSSVAFVNRREQNSTKAYELNVKALAGIRSALVASSSRAVQDDVLIAISFLHMAESMMDSSSGNRRIHYRGMTDMLLRISKRGTDCTDACVKMFWTAVAGELLPAMLRGEDSVFDQPAWLEHSVPKLLDAPYPSAEYIDRYLKERCIRLPRLVRLIRRLIQAPEVDCARNEAVDLAGGLYFNTLEAWVQQLFQMGLVWLSSTSSATQDSLNGSSLDFKSVRVYQRFVCYCQLRCLICGCVLALCKLSPACNSLLQFNSSVAAAQDVEAAEYITMCTEYSRKSASPIPIRELWQCQPVMYSFGSWHRLEQRAMILDERERARSMKQWAVDFMNEVVSKWSGRQQTIEEVEYLHEVLMGGPLQGGT